MSTGKAMQYAHKFLADNSINKVVNDETLQEAFKNCVIPASSELYPEIKIAIEELKKVIISNAHVNIESIKKQAEKCTNGVICPILCYEKHNCIYINSCEKVYKYNDNMILIDESKSI